MAQLVSYVLLAECELSWISQSITDKVPRAVDIDEGSILRHEYPEPTGTNDHLLAELMLPDGAHARSEDWTIFYLNQIPATAVKPKTPSAHGSPLLHVMSSVRTKHDDRVRR